MSKAVITTATIPTGPKRVRSSPFRSLLRSRVAVAGLFIVVLMALLAIAAPLVAPFDPNEIVPARRLQAPNTTHLFGTDQIGRDIFSRVLYGGRTSLSVGLFVVVTVGVFGGVIGLISGFYPRVDNVLMRVMDGMMAFPSILLAIALMASLGSSVRNVVIALTIVYTPRVARVARAVVLVIRELPFVEAGRALGETDLRLLFRHVAPNTLGPVNVQLTFIFAFAVLAEASLSFLGVGPPPSNPTWGNILSSGRSYLTIAPWITIFPGLAIVATVLGLNLLGDGLRDLLDPKLRGSQSE